MKRFLLPSLLLLALIMIALYSIQSSEGPPARTAKLPQNAGGKGSSRQYGNNRQLASPSSSDLLPSVNMEQVDYEPKPEVDTRPHKDPPYTSRGGAGTGALVDREGHVIMASSKEFGIFGAAVGPDEKLVLVKGGDAKNFVLDPAKGEKFQLPVHPPGENMLGFGNWHWIGARTLLGDSGDQALDKQGQPVKSDNNVARTRLYVYDLLTQQFSEVAIPNAVTQPVLNVFEVKADGHVHLFLEAPPHGTEPDLGWFKISLPQ